jgi:CBS domain-containing protein
MKIGQEMSDIEELNRIKVSRIMMPSKIIVPPDFSVAETLAVLRRHRLGAVPVVDGTGSLMGVVTLGQIDRLLAVLARQGQGDRSDHDGKPEPMPLARKGGRHAGQILDAPEG